MASIYSLGLGRQGYYHATEYFPGNRIKAMSSKLIRKSLQLSIDRKKKRKDSLELHKDEKSIQKNYKPQETQPRSQPPPPNKMTQQELLQIQVQSMLKFDKYSSKQTNMDTQNRVMKKRMESFKEKEKTKKQIHSQTMKPNGMIMNSRSSSSILKKKSIKAPRTVSKNGEKKRREHRAMAELVKRLKKHEKEKKRLRKNKKGN